ncbi:ubiquinol oxidase subunit II [Sinirhodobacter huangdaonensis]|uniref:Ubiquinol oxidase subunit 2 n=1 Tax=Paenirhodobacter huangdaonensis TaxID=2501515 RepID=A0A3S3LTM7_9RHOB|nr:ubiquinol oxidase subunit II [Sinirhodobacter huangdaonensis]RWR52177.1 ubiquinol oxidase subunit II [Sinirhodobacter huangdaonensis]
MLRSPKLLLATAGAFALSGCQFDVLSPQGWVAGQERNLLVIATLLMLIVIVPVLFMAVYFPLRYRADRPDSTDYDPEFTHSNTLEVVVWGVPILIILALGAVTWIYTHRLDPYRDLSALNAGTPVEVEAVSLDWKWLFIYPELGVASVNELAIPAGRPVNFRLSSSTVMNTLSIPALGGMVYAMAGMETQLHLIADAPGTFAGRSAHYSGPGFSQMTFDTRAMSEDDFNAWVAAAKASPEALTRDTYLALERPTIGEPVRHYGSVEDGLFARIVGLCVEAGKVCVGDMMMQDKMGGGGLNGIANAPAYSYDRARAIDGFGNPLDLPAPEPKAFHEAFLTNPDLICGTGRTEAAIHVN